MTDVLPLVWPAQEMVDDVVGIPATKNENGLPVMSKVGLIRSVMKNKVVGTDGAFKKKLKESPLFAVVRAVAPLPKGPYVGTANSEEIADVAP